MAHHQSVSVGGRSRLLTAPLLENKIQPLSFLSARVFPASNVRPLTFVPGNISTIRGMILSRSKKDR